MAKNRVKQRNTIQSRRLWHWFAICSVLTVFGLVLVFLQIRIHRLAETRSELTEKLEEIQQKNQALQVQIERHKHPDQLKEKVARFDLGMVEISDPDVVVIETDFRADAYMARRQR